jgi:hypothetical protein
LARAEIVAQDESAEIRLDVSALVERLSGDLIRLYDDLERGALAQSDRVNVLPELEFMREVLRRSYSRPRSIRDALSKALAPIPGSPP